MEKVHPNKQRGPQAERKRLIFGMANVCVILIKTPYIRLSNAFAFYEIQFFKNRCFNFCVTQF
jgi:hypothetical protein